jgi:DNA-binding response OmpR family regulator
LKTIWEVNPSSNTRTIDVHIKRLRGKLGALAFLIKTEFGIGYVIS